MTSVSRLSLDWHRGDWLSSDNHTNHQRNTHSQTSQTPAVQCVTEESVCLPREEAFISKWWSLSSSDSSRRQLSLSLSLKQVVLAVSPQTTPPPLPHPPSENNRPGCVCQLFEKLTTISNCTYYSQLLEQLGSGKTPWSANRNGSHQRAVEWLINR